LRSVRTAITAFQTFQDLRVFRHSRIQTRRGVEQAVDATMQPPVPKTFDDLLPVPTRRFD